MKRTGALGPIVIAVLLLSSCAPSTMSGPSSAGSTNQLAVPQGSAGVTAAASRSQQLTAIASTAVPISVPSQGPIPTARLMGLSMSAVVVPVTPTPQPSTSGSQQSTSSTLGVLPNITCPGCPPPTPRATPSPQPRYQPTQWGRSAESASGGSGAALVLTIGQTGYISWVCQQENPLIPSDCAGVFSYWYSINGSGFSVSFSPDPSLAQQPARREHHGNAEHGPWHLSIWYILSRERHGAKRNGDLLRSGGLAAAGVSASARRNQHRHCQSGDNEV